MAITFSDVYTAYYAANVSNDANYEAPGNFNIPTAFIDGQHEKNLLTCLEVIRAYIASIGDFTEAKTFHECVAHMLSALPLGGGVQSGGGNNSPGAATFPASTAATRAQKLALGYFSKQIRPIAGI